MRLPLVWWFAILLVGSGCRRHAAEDVPAPAVVDGTGLTAFVDVTLVPMDADHTVPHQTVLVRGATIEKIVPATEPVPVHAKQIAGHGQFLMPGLTDMHVHTASEANLTMYIANGVTTVRDMFGNPGLLVWRDKITKGELLGPTMIIGSQIIDGDPPVWPGSAVVKTPADASAVVHQQKLAGYDFLKVYDHLTLAAYDAIVAAARVEGMHVAGHVPPLVPLEHALASGQTSIEHLTGYLPSAQRADSPLRGKTDFWSVYFAGVDHVDEARLAELVKQTKAAGAWNVPTLVVTDAMVLSSAEVDARVAEPSMKFVDAAQLAAWRQMSVPPHEADVAIAHRVTAFNRKLVVALHAAGAHLLVGTDSANPWVVHGFAVHTELANLVGAGLTPYEALRASTRDAAEYLGTLAHTGTVEVGKRADLLLVAENPLVDVTNAAKRTGVMVGGTWFTAAELDAKLAAILTAAAKGIDRFAKLPRPAGTLVGRYETRFMGQLGGEERIFSTPLPDGGVHLIAQEVIDPPYSTTSTAELDVDKGGVVRRVAYTSKTDKGDTSLVLVRDRDHYTLTGTTPDEPAVKLAGSASAVAWLAGPMFVFVATLGTATTAVPGEAPLLELAIDKPVHLGTGTVRIKRTKAGDLTLTAVVPRGGYTATLTTDAAHRIATATWTGPDGLAVDYRRVE